MMFHGFVTGLLAAVLWGAAPGAALAQDDFMKECRVTTSEKMCQCIYDKLPADKRAAATQGLSKSNAATKPGGNLLDPSTLSQEQMQGLDAMVLAQANCMP
jgi:hypothetical protein